MHGKYTKALFFTQHMYAYFEDCVYPLYCTEVITVLNNVIVQQFFLLKGRPFGRPDQMGHYVSSLVE